MSSVVVISGVKEVLESVSLFGALAQRSGQTDVRARLQFQLSVPYFGTKLPHAVLLRNEADEIFAVGLFVEYRYLRIRSGIFMPADADGDLALIALPEHRLEAAAVIAQYLLKRRGRIILMCLPGRFEKDSISGCAPQPLCSRARSLRRKLRLLSTVDETLSQMGARSRRNLRAFSRRAVQELGAVFESDVRISEEDLIDLNRMCAYPVPDWVAALRFRSTKSIAGGFLSGLRSGSGNWLSLLGGRRYGCECTIDWQMNRADLGTLSIGTAMRFFQIQREADTGSSFLHFSGGTPHSIQNAFIEETVTELLWMSWPYSTRVVRRLVERFLLSTNALKPLLSSCNADADLETVSVKDESASDIG